MPLTNSIHVTATVAPNSTVSKSELQEHSRIKNNVEFRESLLGQYSYVSSNSIVNKTDIGKFTSIGPGCYIGLWEHDTEVSTHSFYLYETSGFFVKGYRNYKRDVIKTYIGNDVWVGAGVSIKKGLAIGDGAIIGSGSVVTKDVGAFSIMVGNPARILRYRYDEEDRLFLKKIAWWNLSRDEIQKMVDEHLFEDFSLFKEYFRTRK